MTSNTTSLTELCDVCEDTLSRMLDSSEEKVDHQSSYADLTRSAADNCLICADVIDNMARWSHHVQMHSSRPLTSWNLGNQRDRKKPTQVYVYLNDYDGLCSMCDLDEPPHVVRGYDFTPVTTHSRSGDREERRFSTVFSNYTDSAETTLHITNWMEQCKGTHDVCKEGREDTWMPSRLLEISNVRGDLHLRLRDRSELQSSRYCTLSHRWGTSSMQSHQLNICSLNSFRNGVAVSTLRPTFQEMADLTWRLGMNLMWIDCMCIVQDDAEDWRDESALMGKVYLNSWLNVSATARDASCSGLYAERNVAYHLGHFRTWYDRSGEATTWTVTVIDEWWEEVEEAPVNKRGWVLQERILSPRIVHMCSNQVYWECRQLQASEHLPAGEPTYRESMNSHSKMKRICYGNQDKDKDEVFAEWEHLLQRYAGCDLTYETDRLIALSGIASMVHKRIQCDYLAGFWIKRLPVGLLWYSYGTVAETMTNGNGSPKYVAPSWSWASVINDVNWPRQKTKTRTYASIQRYKTSLANPADMFGAVLAGMIELRAPLGTLDWIRTRSTILGDYPLYDITDIKISIPTESGNTETIAGLSSIHHKKQLLFLDRREHLDLETAYFAVIRTQSKASHLHTENHTWHLGYNVQGLLLKHLPCSRYMRIGVALLEFDKKPNFISKIPEQDVIII